MAWLYQEYEIAVKRNKLLALASAMEKAGVSSYKSYYLRQAAGPITWYRSEIALDLDAIMERFETADNAYLGETGALPNLEENGKPRINRVRRFKDDAIDEIVVELAALDLHRIYRRNWQSQEIVVDHDYRVTISAEPAVIEIRSGALKASDIYEPIKSIVGANILAEARAVVMGNDEARLKKALHARSRKAYGMHEHLVLSRSTVESRVDVDLQESDEHKKWLKQDGVKENAHAYVLTATWPDGFREKVGYKVDRDDGEVSLSTANASEIAIAVLRNSILAL